MPSIIVSGKVEGSYYEYSINGRLISFCVHPEEYPELFACLQQALWDAGLYAPVKSFFGNKTGLHAVAYCEAEAVKMLLFVTLEYAQAQDRFFVKCWYDSFQNRGSANHPCVLEFGGRVM
jgi:hypothetical protein